MAGEKEQHEPREDMEARTETAPEPPEVTPRGNVHSEPDEGEPGAMPAPLPY